MSGYFIYYAESNIVCLVIFGILLFHDLFNTNRQEKQIKYDHALIGFMAYFISDTLWAMVNSGVVPKSEFMVAFTNFANFIMLATVTYLWLAYVMAVEQVPHRARPINKFAVLFPFIISTLVLVSLYVFAPRLIIDDTLEETVIFEILMGVVPLINICAILVYTLRKAKNEKERVNRRKHLYIGFFPLVVTIIGIIQLLFVEELSIFCFGCTVLMLILHIQSMETQISTDPLTKLNNRGQFLRYVSQPANLYVEGKNTFVIIMDVNNFKTVNDTYGHAEGDRALIMIAEALTKVLKRYNMPDFLCRYGGDEFVIIMHSDTIEQIVNLIAEIKLQVAEECEINKTPYVLSIAAGYDEFINKRDTIQNCMQRVDKKLYLDKEYSKLQAKNDTDK